MAQKNRVETQPLRQELLEISEPEDVKSSAELPISEPEDVKSSAELPISELEDVKFSEELPVAGETDQDIDGILNSLKALLSAVEKLQKVRQDVGNIKPLLGRMLDGELVSGEELEQLKLGVNGLLRLVRAYTDHQAALTKAQPARSLLDQVLKGQKPDEQATI